MGDEIDFLRDRWSAERAIYLNPHSFSSIFQRHAIILIDLLRPDVLQTDSVDNGGQLAILANDWYNLVASFLPYETPTIAEQIRLMVKAITDWVLNGGSHVQQQQREITTDFVQMHKPLFHLSAGYKIMTRRFTAYLFSLFQLADARSTPAKFYNRARHVLTEAHVLGSDLDGLISSSCRKK